MTKQRDTFILRCDFFPQIKMLTREQRGDLLMAIFSYTTEDLVPEMDGITQMCFGFIKASLDANSSRYQSICERNKENGSRGGRPTTETQNNRTVSEKTERLFKEPTATSGLSGKPNQNSLNPIEFELDTDTEFELDTDSENNLSLSENLAQERRERESFLKVLLFEKKLQDPVKELSRFEAHYTKSGWLDANGNPIRNRLAALKAWSPDKDATQLPLKVVAQWRGLFDYLKGDRLPMLECFRGWVTEGQKQVIVASDKCLMDFLESKIDKVRECLNLRFGDHKLEYRILK